GGGVWAGAPRGEAGGPGGAARRPNRGGGGGPAGRRHGMGRWQPPAVLCDAGLWLSERAGRATGWTGQHLRHVAEIVHQGRNPAARVYESIGSECFVGRAPGWLSLGLWEGPGTEAEAGAACRRLVQTVASALPAGGVTIDVGNGLGTQDPLIAEAIRPRRLIAVNIAEWQLSAGLDRLREA